MAEAKKTKEEVIKLPKSLAACADLLYQTQQQRYEIQHSTEKLAKLETALKARFIAELSTEDTTGIAGKVARVSITSKTVPVVEDWEEFWAKFNKNKDKDLLTRAISADAVRQRWEAGKAVPGVGTFISKSLSIKKV